MKLQGAKCPLLYFMRYCFYIIAIYFLNSCGDSNNNALLAKVGNAKLTVLDFNNAGFIYSNKEDSLRQLKLFVKSWIEKQLYYQNANENNSENDETEKMVEDFKQNITIANFENDYLNKNLDTVISHQQLNNFYEKNKHSFSLNDYVVNSAVIKLPYQPEKNEKISSLIKQMTLLDVNSIEKKINEFHGELIYEAENWIYFSELLREINYEIDDKASFLEKKNFIESNDGEFAFYVKIFGFRLNGEASPLSLVKETVKKRILHQRTKELLTNLRKQIIKERYNDNVEAFIK